VLKISSRATAAPARDCRKGKTVEKPIVDELGAHAQRQPTPAERLARLRRPRGALPADDRFDRQDAYDAEREDGGPPRVDPTVTHLSGFILTGP
jgi:hypothetical protein